MSEKSPKNEVDSAQNVFEYLKLNVELYKHHTDLFLKGFALYLAVVGTLSGLLFSDRVNNQTRKYLAVIVTVGSVLAFVGCLISYKQIKVMDLHMTNLCSQLALEPIPLLGPKRILIIKLVISGLFVIAGVIFIIMAG
jgi:hypothetical protein